jgi:hypothetical protein
MPGFLQDHPDVLNAFTEADRQDRHLVPVEGSPVTPERMASRSPDSKAAYGTSMASARSQRRPSADRGVSWFHSRSPGSRRWCPLHTIPGRLTWRSLAEPHRRSQPGSSQCVLAGPRWVSAVGRELPIGSGAVAGYGWIRCGRAGMRRRWRKWSSQPPPHPSRAGARPCSAAWTRSWSPG